LFALAFDQDRQWKITVGGKDYRLSEYNDEITGFDDDLHDLAPDVIHYGGNAYYVTGRFAESKGWCVEQLPRGTKLHGAEDRS
jgi:hypothetical protein